MAGKTTATKYRVLCWGACTPESPCGINYPSTKTALEVRAETGDVIDDIPPHFAPALIEAGLIEVAAEDVPAQVEGGAR